LIEQSHLTTRCGSSTGRRER